MSWNFKNVIWGLAIWKSLVDRCLMNKNVLKCTFSCPWILQGHLVQEASFDHWGLLPRFLLNLELTNSIPKQALKDKYWFSLLLDKSFNLESTISGLLCWISSKESAWNARDLGSISGSGRSPGGGNGNLFQCSCLGYSMDRGVWEATVHGLQRVRHDWVHTYLYFQRSFFSPLPSGCGTRFALWIFPCCLYLFSSLKNSNLII